MDYGVRLNEVKTYKGLTVTFGVDIVSNVVRIIESGRNVILCFMGNTNYESYMRNAGVTNFKITEGPEYDGANQCLSDCWPEIKNFYNWCFNEWDFIPVADKWNSTFHNVALYSEKLKTVIKIGFPLFSGNTIACRYLAEMLMTEVSYEIYTENLKRHQVVPYAQFTDSEGHKRYALRSILY